MEASFFISLTVWSIVGAWSKWHQKRSHHLHKTGKYPLENTKPQVHRKMRYDITLYHTYEDYRCYKEYLSDRIIKPGWNIDWVQLGDFGFGELFNV